ncbi:ParA family protein [Streptomyces sp. NPDC004111]|uniref:ParA family protein n=1 Tax=Streptomyces sp. NPDC004111 TaxID=3364690 RepID=UPI0036C0BA80
MDIYCMTNQKGGVGKTADTIGLAAALAEDGQRVLVVDFDAQGHLTDALGLPETTDPATLKNALLGEWDGDVHELVFHYRTNFDVIPWNLDQFMLLPGLYMSQGREHRLSRLLEAFEDEYDVCLIDCAPSLAADTDAALMAARRRPGRKGGVLVPVEAEDSSIRALHMLLTQIETLADLMRADIDIVGLVPSKVDIRRGAIATSTLEAFESLGVPPVLAVIKDRTEIRKAWRAKKSVLEYAPQCEASEWYRGLAKAVLAA